MTTGGVQGTIMDPGADAVACMRTVAEPARFLMAPMELALAFDATAMLLGTVAVTHLGWNGLCLLAPLGAHVLAIAVGAKDPQAMNVCKAVIQRPRIGRAPPGRRPRFAGRTSRRYAGAD